MKQCLEWLRHVARMPNSRIFKITLFGWLSLPRPKCEPKRRWRDVVKRDLQAANINVNTWYDNSQHRKGWIKACNDGADNYQLQQWRQRQLAPKEVRCSACVQKTF